MFTGIIKSIGRVLEIKNCQGDQRFTFHSGQLSLSNVELGDSISVNGVCLTVVQLNSDSFVADVSLETLERSTLSNLKQDSVVNLEEALMPSSRLGGHLVSGHVDGVARVVSIGAAARSSVYWIELPKELARYVAEKGSITVDGVSLTVNKVDNDQFSLNIVPYTQEETIISDYKVGTKVNLEVDILARYLERLMDPDLRYEDKSKSSLTEDTLMKYGYM